MASKTCPQCKVEYDITGFNKAPKRADGLRAWCKGCERRKAQEKIYDLRQKVYHKLGDSCQRCGFADQRALQIDHVRGGGNKEHAEIKNNKVFLNKVLADSEGTYQILCANCNWIKRHENKEVQKEYRLSEHGRAAIVESRTNFPITAEHRKKLSDSHLGIFPTDEHREKTRQTSISSWADPEIRERRIAGMNKSKNAA